MIKYSLQATYSFLGPTGIPYLMQRRKANQYEDYKR